MMSRHDIESRLAAVELAFAPYTTDLAVIDREADGYWEALERVQSVEGRRYYDATGFGGPAAAFPRLYIRRAMHEVVRSYTLDEQHSPEGYRVSPDPETMLRELEDWASTIADVYEEK